MNMEIYWDEYGKLTDAQVELLNRVVLAVVEHVPGTSASEVNISIMDEDEIRRLNRDFRGLDSATDVLSFPVHDEFIKVQGMPLGDIAICMDVARRQADEYGHSLERELAFLVAHGMLHLLGFDHETPEDEAKMLAAQDEILGQLGINR